MKLVYPGVPFTFELTPAELRVRIGPWILRRVRAVDVASVRLGRSLWCEHWSNFWPARFVTIRRKEGWFKDLVINPVEPELFVRELSQLFGVPLAP